MTLKLGDYEVLSELGRGGSAKVYRARGPSGAVVAVKLLPGAAGHDAYARFAREERLLASLGEAEGFVPLIETGVSEHGPFFVMPLLAGGTLRERLVKGPLGYEETLALARALATALGWAHARGVVHRDVKPENVLFARLGADPKTPLGRPLLADLGIAKHFKDATSRSESLTDEGGFLGTPAYMSPEQMDCSKSVDARADVFALGALLYECLVGEPPFLGSTLAETMARVAKGEYRRLEAARPDVPLDLAYPIGTALNENPEFRYADGFAFAKALGAKLPHQARVLPTVREPARRPRRRSPVLVLAPLLLAGGLLLSGHGKPPTVLSEPPVALVRSAASPAPPSPALATPSRKGWAGEPLPRGLRLGRAKPLYVFSTEKGLELELVYVPPGDFFMGAINGAAHEKPLHTHTLARGYYMARTEVTWDQYLLFARATARPERPRPAWAETGAHPVSNVRFEDAQAFCAWAGLALPTEPEWEKAARGPDDTRQWPWGDEWRDGAAALGGAGAPPVGSAPAGASPYGALDMAGGVAEWTADFYDEAIYVAYSNGRTAPPERGDRRVVRGGSWRETRFGTTVSARSAAIAETARDDLGFRPILRTGG